MQFKYGAKYVVQGWGRNKIIKVGNQTQLLNKTPNCAMQGTISLFLRKMARAQRLTAFPFSTAIRNIATVATRARANERPLEIPAPRWFSLSKWGKTLLTGWCSRFTATNATL